MSNLRGYLPRGIAELGARRKPRPPAPLLLCPIWMVVLVFLGGDQGWADRVPKIEGIRLSGYAAVEEQVARDLLDLEVGDVFAQGRLEAGIERLLGFYENRGYPFAAIRIERVALTSGGDVELEVGVNEGPRVTIGAIQVRGNPITRDEVILRELRVRPGDLYDQRRLDRGIRYVKQLEFIERVDPPEIRYRPRSGKAIIEVPIQEGRTSRIDAVVGYVPGTVMEKGHFTGLVDLALGNLLGTGRSVGARWERRDRDTSELFVAYKEPWILGFPVTLGVRFGQQQRPAYTQTRTSIEVDLPLSERWHGTARIGRESTIPDSVGRFVIPKSRTWIGGLTLIYDTRDERMNPRYGLLYRSTAEIGLSRTSASDRNRTDRRRYGLDLEQFFPLGRRQVIALGFHGAAVQSEEPVLPISEKLYLGGSQSLRGYREEQFPAARMVWMNLELRHHLEPQSRVFLFLDGGYYADQRASVGGEDIQAVEGVQWGYGCGVRLRVRTGILGIDYGLGEGDRFLDGKVHVGIVNSW